MKAYAAAFAFVVAILGLIYWGFWHLWKYVLGALWPTGPEAIVSPDFLVFVGALFLLSLIGKTVFGGSKD